MIRTKDDKPARHRLIRVSIVLASLVLLFYFVRQSTWLSSLEPGDVRELVQQWGELGILIYALAFTAGLLLYVPGTIFIVVAGVLYGPFWGSLIAFVVANFAVFVSFNLIRWLGGTSTAGEIHPVLNARLNKISRQPVLTVAFLRTFLWTAPVLNYLLALTAVEQRHHLVGTLLGTVVPIVAIVLASDWFLVRWSAN
ncbi:MAG: VTT domain-containing protein [Pseudomonadota bacterium]